ncbi:MAG: hypothetical protein H6729_12175 [Deltaproteobacteria bacterium]|nr:hypothetical protein [Deltaproteobacteria bacterium]
MNKVKEELKKEIEDLKRLRDELRVQAHLGKAEAKDAWSRLEASWPDVEEKLKVIESETSEFADNLFASAKGLVAEIREGYSKFRR